MKNEPTVVLSSDDVLRSITMAEAIDCMRTAFAALSSGKAVVPQRLHVDLHLHNAVSLTMPAYLPQLNRMSEKVVIVAPDNPGRGLPTVLGTVSLFDAATGRLLALMDGSSVTGIRTGAASGLASDLLADESSNTLALFGAGVQSVYQLRAVCAVRPIKRVLVWDIIEDITEQFVQKMSAEYNLDYVCNPSASELQQADIVCTATNSMTPVFDDKNLADSVHINAVGSFRPDMQEIPTETMARATLTVDSREGTLAETGDMIIPIAEGRISADHIACEIGELVLDSNLAITETENLTLFKSVGNAIQDLTVADRIYEFAVENGIGQRIMI